MAKSNVMNLEITQELINECPNMDPYRGAVATSLRSSGKWACKAIVHTLYFRKGIGIIYHAYTFSDDLRQWMEDLMTCKKVNPIRISLDHKNNKAYIDKEYMRGQK